MSEDMRLVLNKLDDLNIRIDKMETRINDRIDGMDSRLNARIDGLETRLDGVETRLNGVETRLNGVETRLENVETELTKVWITMEQDISRKIDVIGEGHDFLKIRIAEVEKKGAKSERMELEVINLGMDVKKIKQHIALA